MLQNKLRRRMLFFALSCCVPFLSIAQELDPALKALVAKGLQKSHSVNAFELDAKLAKVDQNLAKSVFLPKVTLSGSCKQFYRTKTLNKNIWKFYKT